MKYNLADDKLLWKIVHWWKSKVIWQRPIMSYDAKALRMIESKLKTLNKNYKSDDASFRALDMAIAKNHEMIYRFNAEWQQKKENEK